MRKFLLSACLAAAAVCSGAAAVAEYDAQQALVSAKADIPNWMSYLPDDVFVAHVSIPGTHDAATGHEWDSSLGVSMSTTQCTTLSEQLEGGIRAFDFRPGLKNNTDHLVCAHGTTYLKLTLDEAFKTLTDFLDAHPKEFFVIHLFRGNIYRAGEGSSTQAQRDQYNELFDKTFNKGDFSKYLVDYVPELTVGDIRGKIVVFRRDRIDFAHIEKAGNLTNWPGDEEQWSANNHATARNATHPSEAGPIYVTDISSPKKDQLELELTSITDLYNFSTSQITPNEARAEGLYRPYWVMCFTSGEYAGTGTKAYLQNAVETNPHLTSLINNSEKKGPVGIVFSDWVLADKHTYKDIEYDVKGNDLVNAIIENNFGYIDRFMIDKDLFTPITNANNWDDTRQYFVRNAGTGLLLSSGATWGTHAVLNKYGIRVVPCYDKYTDTYVLATTQGNGFVGTDGDNTFFTDYAPASVFKIAGVDGKDAYTLTMQLDGAEKAMTAEAVAPWTDGTEYMVEPRDPEDGNALQQWELVSVDEYFAALLENASETESADITDMLPGHHFWPNDKNNWTGVTDTYSSIACEGVDSWNDKDLLLHCHNKKTSSASLVKKTKWTIEKTVEGLPAGSYTLSFHAAELNLKDKEGFSMKVNGEEVKDKVATATSDKAADAIALFREKSDEYTLSHDFELKEPGKLTIELTNGEVTGTAACLFVDNFSLLYNGKKASSGIAGIETAENGTVDVYSVAGLQLRAAADAATALDGLEPGLYIVRTATTATKVIKR